MAGTWGFSTYGSSTWGGVVDVTVSATGNAGTSALGTVSVAAAAGVTATGNAGTTGLGSVTVSAAAGVSASGNAGTTALGSVSVSGVASVTATGTAGTSALGSISLSTNNNICVTSDELTGGVGNAVTGATLTIPLQGFPLRPNSVQSLFGASLFRTMMLLGRLFLLHNLPLGQRLLLPSPRTGQT